MLPGGSLVLQSDLDYESIPSYNLTISARDSGLPPLVGITNVVINVLDVNDNIPIISMVQTTYSVPEVSYNTTIGHRK